jgi:hypothetical protein
MWPDLVQLLLYECVQVKTRIQSENFLVKMKFATGKDIAEQPITTAKTIPASGVKERCVQLLIIIHRL